MPRAFGGDEFAIVLPETDLKSALEVARRLRQRAAGVSGTWLEDFEGITISVGMLHVAQVTEDLDARTLLSEADRCLYAAKADGRNCVRYRSI